MESNSLYFGGYLLDSSTAEKKNVISLKKNLIFWHVMPCRSCKTRCFGGTYCLHHQDEKINELETTMALVTAKVVPSSLNLSK
jgi:hypothetical protein